ncbi:MAG: septal ring lytic transglycosylase RlpA family protein [Acetobacteraceae bacterium]
MARRRRRILWWIAAGFTSAAILVLAACAANRSRARAEHPGPSMFAAPAAEGPLSLAQREHARGLARLPPIVPPKAADPPADHSGRTEQGKASYYGPEFQGKTMANGRKFNPNSDAAASKTLPLGTTAKVVNQANGKSANVTIQDRGPHIAGRIIDVSPNVARQLHMNKKGVASVEVKPIAVPQPNGKVTLGAGAAGAPPGQVEKAVQTSKDLPKN